MQHKFRFILLAFMLTPQAVMLWQARSSALAADKTFNYLAAVSLTVALFIGLLGPPFLYRLTLAKPFQQLRSFCEKVKTGEYQTRLPVPNQPRHEEEDDSLALVMRDMNWMARQIELREQQLQDNLADLKESKQHIDRQNHSLRIVNAELQKTQCCLQDRALQLEAAFTRMHKMAQEDPLTQIANRRCFFEALDQQLSSRLCSRRSLSLLMLDVDHFKQVNDTYGHVQGDQVLQILARIMAASCRETDLPARIGGEEFGLLLPDTDTATAVRVAKRIHQAAAAYHFTVPGEIQFSITVSIGICTLDSISCLNRGNLYSFADQALYHAKHSGRNSISVYDGDAQAIAKVG